jgi:hypothetical protein
MDVLVNANALTFPFVLRRSTRRRGSLSGLRRWDKESFYTLNTKPPENCFCIVIIAMQSALASADYICEQLS